MELGEAVGARTQCPQPQLPPQQPPPPPVAERKLGCGASALVAKTENCRTTFVAPQSGQAGSRSPRTSSSKCDSHVMQTYS